MSPDDFFLDAFNFDDPFTGRRHNRERMDGERFPGPPGFFGFDPFRHVGRLFRETENMMRHFDEVFDKNGFGRMDMEEPLGGRSAIEGRPQAELSPRDRMLRAPGDEKTKVARRDDDYDDVVARRGLDSVMKKEEARRPQENFFAYCSKSFQRQDLGDGRVQEHRTYTDSDGNQHEVTRKSIGDKEYVITNKTTPSGEQQKIEEFNGMEEGDLADFERQFAGRGARNELPPPRHCDGRALDIREKQRPWRSYLIDNLHKWF